MASEIEKKLAKYFRDTGKDNSFIHEDESVWQKAAEQRILDKESKEKETYREIKNYDKSQLIIPNSNTSFIPRRLKVQITLHKGKFKNGSNSLMFSDFAMTASVEKLGPPDFGKCNVEIYGLPLDVIEQVTTLSLMPLFFNRNYINVFAGDERNGYTQIFAGTISNAQGDFNSSPDVKLKIEGRIGFYGSISAQGQNVVNGVQPASDFISRQAQLAGFTFKNEGVTGSLKNAVFSGSPIEQARQAANQIGAELIMDDGQMTLIRHGGALQGQTPLLTAKTGLIGYPTMTSNGIELKAIFDKRFRFAGLIEIQTLVPKCSGTWRIIKLTHKLSSNMVGNGQWESAITAFYPHMSGACGKFI